LHRCSENHSSASIPLPDQSDSLSRYCTARFAFHTRGVPAPAKTELPTPFQRKALWGAITALSIVVIGAIGVLLIALVTRVLAFLQPVLVPLAVAAIVAYLLEPLVQRLVNRRWKRMRAMLTVYFGFHAMVALLVALVVPKAITESIRFVQGTDLNAKFDTAVNIWTQQGQVLTEDQLKHLPKWEQTLRTSFTNHEQTIRQAVRDTQQWLVERKGAIAAGIGSFLGNSFQGAVGILGYLIGFLLVPIYMYYFLKESTAISNQWADYLPLRQSKFKSEVVSTLSEINGYLISFFRGQMLVSLIDGLLVGLCLWLIIQLPYGLMIGLCMAVLGIIPFVGSIICWIPAVLISLAHFSQPDNQWAMFHGHVWPYPLVVTGVFIIVQQINSLVTSPRIVGDSVGLHPLTVIFSVLFWSLLIGGFLGALLAVPLTASVKVLFRRYVWEKRRGQPQPKEDGPPAVPLV
jgi:predicted PurR-regulated permease PerM